MYNILVDDTKTIDLVTLFGDLPGSEESMSFNNEEAGDTIQIISDSKQGIVDSSLPVDATDREEGNGGDVDMSGKEMEVVGGVTVSANEEVVLGCGEGGGVDVTDMKGKESSNLRKTSDVEVKNAKLDSSELGTSEVPDVVHVLLKPHEGVQSRSPFSVSPQTMVSSLCDLV